MAKSRSALIGAGFIALLIGAGIYFCSDLPQKLSSAVKEGVPKGNDTEMLTVIMYHSILKDPARTGDYVVTPSSFEEDMMYLSSHGIESVTAEDIIAFCDRGEPLPEKSVYITFDDGFLNNMTYALPVMERYDMQGEINIVGAYADYAVELDDHNPAYAYLTWDEIAELYGSSRMDIGCHTYDMHSLSRRRGCSRNDGETAEDYRKYFSDDLTRVTSLLECNSGITPVVFAYPYGLVSEESYDILTKNGYRIALTCREKQNELKANSGEELIILGRYNRSGLLSTEEFMLRAGLE
ncbi:MAG: polysaccharide deacetylase family protein [Huintestinicola sp.]